MSRPALTELLHREQGPLYRQAAQVLRAAITGGRLKVGGPLPTEAEMAQGFGISLITIRAALRELEAEGLIRKRAAKTAVVASAEPRGSGVRELNSIGDIIAANDGSRLEIDSYRPVRLAEAAHLFGEDGRTPLPCLRGRVFQGGSPLSEITIFFRPDIGRRMTREDFDDVVVFRAVERKLGIRMAGGQVTVSAQLADAGLAQVLGCAEGAALLASRIVFREAAGAPVQLTLLRSRADRYSLSYEFRGR